MTPGCSLWSPAASPQERPSVRSPSHTQLLTQQTVLWPPNRQTLGSRGGCPNCCWAGPPCRFWKPFLLESFRLGEAGRPHKHCAGSPTSAKPCSDPRSERLLVSLCPGGRGGASSQAAGKGPHNRQVALVCVPRTGRGHAPVIREPLSRRFLLRLLQTAAWLGSR